MKNYERRAEERVPITHRGTLGLQNASAPCLIEEFSSKGFLIMSALKGQVGDILELKSELYPDRFLQCKVCVRHINGDCLGADIVEVSDAGMVLCQQFIGENLSMKRFR